MTIAPAILLTFGLLALAVLLLWIPLPKPRGLPVWPAAALVCACAAGLAGGLLDWRAPVAIIVYAGVAWSAREATNAWLRVPLLVATGVAAFAFALHRIPGFFNPVLAEGVRSSPGAAPFDLHANFDTAVAGLVLTAVFCRPIESAGDWAAMLRRTWPVTVSTLVVVLGLGWTAGFVHPNLKWTPYSSWFLAINLLFTCVTEEAFFRGFILERIVRGLAGRRSGLACAVTMSTLLFGLAHARGGPMLVVLATIAGLHYAFAYLRSGRIEGAILTHFVLNATHFIAFTYPNLAPQPVA